MEEFREILVAVFLSRKARKGGCYGMGFVAKDVEQESWVGNRNGKAAKLYELLIPSVRVQSRIGRAEELCEARKVLFGRGLLWICPRIGRVVRWRREPKRAREANPDLIILAFCRSKKGSLRRCLCRTR